MVRQCKLCRQDLRLLREKITGFCDKCAEKAKKEGILNTWFGKQKVKEEEIKTEVKKKQDLINKILNNNKTRKKVLKKMKKLGLTKEDLEQFKKETGIKK